MIWEAVNIKELRKQHRLSQAVLARLVGTSVRSVLGWESGAYLPNAIHQDALTQLDSADWGEIHAILDNGGEWHPC